MSPYVQTPVCRACLHVMVTHARPSLLGLRGFPGRGEHGATVKWRRPGQTGMS